MGENVITACENVTTALRGAIYGDRQKTCKDRSVTETGEILAA